MPGQHDQVLQYVAARPLKDHLLVCTQWLSSKLECPAILLHVRSIDILYQPLVRVQAQTLAIISARLALYSASVSKCFISSSSSSRSRGRLPAARGDGARTATAAGCRFLITSFVRSDGSWGEAQLSAPCCPRIIGDAKGFSQLHRVEARRSDD